MTDIVIIQADRDAAADLLRRERSYGENSDWIRMIRNGERDNDKFVQAFARHRIDAQAAAVIAERYSAPTGDAELRARELLATAVEHYAVMDDDAHRARRIRAGERPVVYFEEAMGAVKAALADRSASTPEGERP